MMTVTIRLCERAWTTSLRKSFKIARTAQHCLYDRSRTSVNQLFVDNSSGCNLCIERIHCGRKKSRPQDDYDRCGSEKGAASPKWLFCPHAAFEQHLLRDKVNGDEDAERNEHHVVEVAEHGDEIGNQVDRLNAYAATAIATKRVIRGVRGSRYA